jgi:methionine-rich copper-binding protein CopC
MSQMNSLKRPFLLALVTALAVLLLPSAPAWAHNSLAEATPAKNATLKKAPASVKLRFLQKLNAAQASITVTGDAPVNASAIKVDGATGSVTFDPLPNGVYTVAYDVVSKDGHAVKGSYKFTVAAPAPATSSAAPPSPAAPAPATSAAPASAAPSAPPAALVSDEGSSANPVWIVALVIGALLVVGGVVLTVRRRRG